MKAIKVKEGVYWVGGIDWNLRSFHGYLTQRGTTYNAYLIIDEKITLIDTVKSYLTSEMLDRIRSVVDPSKIDYVVCNHVEMDHSGGLPEIMKIAPNAALFCSPKGETGLREHYKENWNFKPMESGTVLNLGKRNLHFILTPMVHWPDNMVVYMPEGKILFSNDAFGQHLASSERFDDEYPLDITMLEARKYYANIVLPYSKQVQKILVGITDIDIEIIADSHGIIWRKHVKEIISGYKSWASNETRKKALIVYDTMWHSTEAMALAIQDAFEQSGYVTSLLSLQYNHISDIMTEVIDSEYICIGSPTLNGRMLPTMAAFLTYLLGLAPKNRKSIVFGSYGWGPKQIEEIATTMTESGFNVVATEKIKYVPSAEDLDALRVRILGLL
ncbi:MAG: FprA family A-type flavoprotein [Porphyromonadaceae bacterium]|nr:MAG: FprA family A-type flavoprotein [Porphyromonadaceae bacterium]